MISWWGTFVCQRLASEMVIPTPPPIPAPRPAPNATRSGPWPSPHTCLQHTDDPNRAPPAVPIIAANATGCRPAQLRLGGCCASGVVSHALALAGLTPSRPNNSIDDGIERRIPVLATSPARTFEGCAITVDGIHNANTSNPVSVLRIALPQCMRDAGACGQGAFAAHHHRRTSYRAIAASLSCAIGRAQASSIETTEVDSMTRV